MPKYKQVTGDEFYTHIGDRDVVSEILNNNCHTNIDLKSEMVKL